MSNNILLTKDMDLQFANGDFANGENTRDQFISISKSLKGDFLADPLLFLDLQSFTNSNLQDNYQKIVDTIKDGYERDSVKDIKINVEKNNITVELNKELTTTIVV